MVYDTAIVNLSSLYFHETTKSIWFWKFWVLNWNPLFAFLGQRFFTITSYLIADLFSLCFTIISSNVKYIVFICVCVCALLDTLWLGHQTFSGSFTILWPQKHLWRWWHSPSVKFMPVVGLDWIFEDFLQQKQRFVWLFQVMWTIVENKQMFSYNDCYSGNKWNC